MAESFLDFCYRSDLDGVQAALKSGTDVNIKNEWGQTGLTSALMSRQTAVGRFLLEQEGIDINTFCDHGWTDLHFAAKFADNSECLAIMLAHPKLKSHTINKKEWGGDTPIWWAVTHRATRCVQMLISDPRTDLNIKRIRC